MIIEKINKAFYFYSIGLLVLLSLVAALVFNEPVIAILPLSLALIVLSFLNIKSFYFLLFASVPLCIEWDLPGGFSTDLPIEPLCIMLMGLTLVYFVQNIKRIDLRFLQSPIIFLIALLLVWAFICIIPSKSPIISLKYALSKIWYLVTYLGLSILIVQSVSDLKKLFWFIFLPLFFTMVYAFIRHALNGFSFELMNEPSLPFYRNHVIYAATVTIFYPFIFLARTWYKSNIIISTFLKFNQLFFPIVIYFTYTRACMLALGVGLVFYFLMKKNWVKKILVISLVVISVIAAFLSYENNYLKYSPEFTKTVYHDSYDNHIEATFEGHDASSMERINMWIGAIRMFPDYPVFGVGPGNFYPYYKSYTVVHYHTWVSDNELKLSCHNYFLLMLSEQGIVGCLLFILLTIVLFFTIESYYHRSNNQQTKNVIICVGVGMSMLYVNLTLSDLIETAKIGSLFYLFIAILINAGLGYFNKQEIQ